MALKTSSKLNLLIRLVRVGGRKPAFWLLSTIPIGLTAGLLEIVFGYAIAGFLAARGIIPPPPVGGQFFPVISHPTLFLLLTGALQAFVLFLSSTATSISYESSGASLRNRLTEMLASPGAGRIPVAQVSALMGTGIPRSGSYLAGFAALIASLGAVLITLLGLIRMSGYLTVVTVVVFVVFAIPLIFTRTGYQKHSGAVYRSVATFQQGLVRAFRNREFLWITGRTVVESDRLKVLNNQAYTDYKKYIALTSLNSAWPQFVGVILVCAIVVASRQGGRVGADILVPFVYLAARFGTKVGQAVTATGNINFARPYVEELLSLVPESPIQVWAPAAPAGTRTVTSLQASHLEIGRSSALKSDVTFSAGPGDFVLITGDSGSGKTTLLMTLIGLVPMRSGKVHWDGIPIETLDPELLRGSLGYSGADPFLIDGTVRDNILIGDRHARISDATIADALAASAAGFVQELPGGLDHRLTEGGEGISAGQKQRLSIARALLRAPSVLLLDEATSNLDVDTEAEVLANIRRTLPNTLILAVSHRKTLDDFATVRIEL